MAKTVYIGNLPYETTRDQLISFFHPRKILSVALPVHRETGRPQGFGFVEFASEEDAFAVIQKFDQTSFGGRTIKVSEARERGRVRRDEGRRGKPDRRERDDYADTWKDK